jgi:hypothetical protein
MDKKLLIFYYVVRSQASLVLIFKKLKVLTYANWCYLINLRILGNEALSRIPERIVSELVEVYSYVFIIFFNIIQKRWIKTTKIIFILTWTKCLLFLSLDLFLENNKTNK